MKLSQSKLDWLFKTGFLAVAADGFWGVLVGSTLSLGAFAGVLAGFDCGVG